MCGPPDFVGIGAQKAGTTWWFDLICDHPGAYHHSAYHKERHFLSAVGAGDGSGVASLGDYATWFPRPPGRITGEWTPDYLYQHWVPPLLAKAAGGAQILVLLRDPIERYRSGLAHQRRQGDHRSVAGTEEAFQRGCYGAQLARWYEHVAREQVLVLLYEECVADPAGQLAATYRFLGLGDSHRPDSLRTSTAATPDKPALTAERVELLRSLYEPDLHLLARLHPQLDLGHWASAPAG